MSNYSFNRLSNSSMVEIKNLNQLADQAESTYITTPSYAINRMRIFSEEFVRAIFKMNSLSIPTDENGFEKNQKDKINHLYEAKEISQFVTETLHQLRKIGNRTAHEVNFESVDQAERCLVYGSHLVNWLMDNYTIRTTSAEPRLGTRIQPDEMNQIESEEDLYYFRQTLQSSNPETPSSKYTYKNSKFARRAKKLLIISVLFAIVFNIFIYFFERSSSIPAEGTIRYIFAVVLGMFYLILLFLLAINFLWGFLSHRSKTAALM